MARLFDQLDRSWTAFTTTPALNCAYPDALALAGNSTGWDAAQAWVRSVPTKQSDRVFGCLCAHATRGDQAAARIVMALLMPGMVRMVNEIRGPSVTDREQMVAAAVWERIATYPIDRRPAQVVSNVLLDARRQALRSLQRRGPATMSLEAPITAEVAEHNRLRLNDTEASTVWVDVVDGTIEVASTEDVSASEELLRLLRERVDDGHLEPALARLIARCRVGDERAADIARECDVNHRTITHRRRQAEAVLAEAQLAAVA